ncbi:MAG: CehA/McbA family metallohydrolase [Deltaproteobacteria bacterium]|nr:CehA/McbA family metallohydrolase [Deltaproteobacteria bacterium]
MRRGRARVDYGAPDMLLDDSGYAREVAMAADGDGRFALVWVRWCGEGERVRMRLLDASGAEPRWASEAVDVSEGRPRGVLCPAVAASSGRVLVAWTERGPRGLAVHAGFVGSRARTVGAGTEPSVAFDSGGRAWVAWRSHGGVRLRPLAGRGSGVPLSSDRGARRPRIVRHPGGEIVCVMERDAGIEVVRADQTGAVRARRTLGHGGVWHHAPDVAIDARGRIWVAWHANERASDGGVDLPKWVVCAALEGRRLAAFAPSVAMKDRDVAKAGIDQCLEFPVLVPHAGGAITVLARGSHCFYRQDLSAGGWSDLRPLGEIVWGCRGRRVAASAHLDGRIVVARREKQGVLIEALPAPADPDAPVVAPLAVAGQRTVRASRSVDRLRAGRHPILFGDLHQHSAHSDGTGTADERYRMARERYGDDFAALSDHESFLGKRTGPGEWSALEEVALRHDRPGRFATIFAYEWTASMFPGPGHKVVYLPRPGRTVLSRDDPGTKDGAGLLARVRSLGGLAFPHHVGWTGADVPSHDPRVQTCWELCSCHGCYEYPGNEPIAHRGALEGQFIRENLDRGLRFGLVASSDGHGLIFHHGISRKRDAFRTGLTAVLAPAIGRAQILAALRARRCYATSGAKIGLWWSADGHPMGSVVRTDGAVRLRARVLGTAAVTQVSVVTNGGVLHEAHRTDREISVDLTAEVPAARGWAYYYLRVVQEDGEMAWSSPIWAELGRRA